MKILVISHEYPPIGGGGANACMFLTREFTRAGHDATILTAKYQGAALQSSAGTSCGAHINPDICNPQKDSDATHEIETVYEDQTASAIKQPAKSLQIQLSRDSACDGAEGKIEIHRVNCLRKKVESSNFLEMLTFLVSAYMQADRLVKKNDYDVCLVFFGIPSGPIALHLKKKYGLPYVVRLGGGDIPGAQKRFTLMYKLLAPALRKIWKEASAVVANSEGLRERALAFESRYPISVIENGVDTDFFHPPGDNANTPGIKCNEDVKGTRAENGTVKILFVSRLLERKGLQYIIPMLSEIGQQVADTCQKDIELIVVGDGPYRQQLEKLTEETGCAPLIRFEGQKNKQEVSEYYRNADIFLLPSKWEGMPNVVLEAMASGLPIIMTPCEGSKELVTDNGYIATYEEMKDRIIDLCIHEEKRKQMGANSLNRVKRDYQWHAIAKRYLELLSDV